MRTVFKNLVVAVITLEARAVLRKYKPKIVAITGSVGKTSTKDAIYAALAQGGRVRKSEKSFNSEIGLPLTILGVPNAWHNPLRWLQNIIDGLFLLVLTVKYPEWLVLEVGADRPGDIRSLAAWLPVDIAVITRLPEMPVHVEFFYSPEAVMEEKAALLDAIRPGGALILFADDERTAKLAHRLPSPGRMRLVRGVKGTLIIDDTYNASPAATEAALETLSLVVGKSDLPTAGRSDFPKGRRIAVLGDMLELGRHSTQEHRKLGAHAAKAADLLLTIGFRARDIAQGALDAGMPDKNILQFEDSGKAGAELQNLLQEGDCVLVKGSQSMRTERVVEEIMAEPERAADLLVRQDAEWKKR